MAYFAAIAFLLALSTPINADGSLEGLVYAPGHASADYYTYPRYAFEYAVRDPHTGDNKAQWEKRDGDLVIGAYSLVEPDGSLRVVEYRADDKTGFNAVVKRIGPNIHPMATPIYKASIPSLGYKSYLPPLIGPVAGLEKLASAPLYNGAYSGNTISSGLLYKSLSPATIKEVAPISPLGKMIEAKVSAPVPLYNPQITPEPIYKIPIINEPTYKGPISPEAIYKGPIIPEPMYKGPIIIPEPIYKRPIIPEPMHKGPIIIPEPIYKRPIIPEPMHKGPIIIPEPIYKRPIIPEPMYKGPIIIPEPIYKRPIIPEPMYKGPIIIPEPIYKGPIISQPIYKGPIIPEPIYKGPIIPQPIYKGPILPTYKVPNPQIPVYKSPMVQKSYSPAILPLSILKQTPLLREPIYSSRLKNLDPNAYRGIDNNLLNKVLLDYKKLINAPLGYKDSLEYNAPLIYNGYTGSGWGYGR